MPEAARTLGKNSQNNKSFGLAYWQARALLMEELTGQTIRTLLDNTDRIDNEGPVIDKDLSPIKHDVSIYDF